MTAYDQRGLIRFGSVFDLWRKLRALQPDLIQGLEPYYGFSRFRIPLKVLPLLYVIRLYIQITKTPFFFHVLENVPPQRKYGLMLGWAMQQFGTWYAAGAQFILFANSAARDNILMWKPIVLIERSLWGLWGADERVFYPQLKEKSPRPLVLFAGSLSQQKGIIDVLEAFRRLVAHSPTVKLQIIGHGPLESVVREWIRSHELQSRVTLLGSVPHESMAQYLASAWVLVAPSRTVGYVAEQVGLLNIEALLCGTPVIASDAGSAHEFLAQDGGAVIVPEGNIEALTNALQGLISTTSYRVKLSREAVEFGLSHYSYAHTLPGIERQILRLSATSRAALRA